MASADQLETVDESWNSALVIVAHPDDLEYGAAAAVARWTDQSKHVAYALATSGEAGIDAIEPAECGPLREREQRDAAREVGVEDVEFFGFPDGVLEYGLPLRHAIAAAVRRHRPDVVVTSNHHTTWAHGGVNQADHIALGRAVIDGTRDAGNRWVFRDLVDAGLEPVKVGTLLVANSRDARHGVDVTSHFDRGVASLEAHAEYLRGLGAGSGMSDAREFLESQSRPTGTQLGTTFGVAFEVINL